MKLSVHFVGQRCLYRAFEEVPDDEVPAAIRNKYAVTVTGDDGVIESPILEPAPPAPKRQVKARKRARR